ncbi:MAG: hypothetical protein WC449_04310 [Candidatus Paceibacterota bacterium]
MSKTNDDKPKQKLRQERKNVLTGAVIFTILFLLATWYLVSVTLPEELIVSIIGTVICLVMVVAIILTAIRQLAKLKAEEKELQQSQIAAQN